MNHQHLICQVCYAQIPLEPDHLYQAHLRWHRTLSNIPMKETPMKPSIGRIVHYVSKIDNGPGNEVVSPAIIIATRSDLVPSVIERWGPEPTEVGPSPVDGKSHLTTPRPDVEIALHDDETVHLLVHGLGKDYREYGVKHDADGGLGTWHWPERVE